MKVFHIGDILSVTTERLVSERHMAGVYDVLNFLTGDSLYTHQLPRANEEVADWVRAQYPQLFPEDPTMSRLLMDLTKTIDVLRKGHDEHEKRDPKFKQACALRCVQWVSLVRNMYGLPEMLPLHAMGDGMHLHVDPLEELEAMVGKDRVIAIRTEEGK
jgi:hypothetical protein